MITLLTSRSARVALSLATTGWLTACAVPVQPQERLRSADEVVLEALSLLGVPYRWGGSDPRRGFDCSGLVRHVFKTVVAVDLPRRSEDMGRFGRGVSRDDLQAGDLLFFNTLGHANSHVALYLGDGRFIHAPGRGRRVRVDELDDRYWREHFDGARRIDLGAADQASIRGPSADVVGSNDAVRDGR
jgi:cell wall-associated NlpC family hydrolase